MENLNPPALHGEVVAGRASSVRKQLILLSDTLSRNSFDIADLLFEAETSGYLPGWGFRSIGEYAEKELGIKKRRAQYLVRIVKVCRALGLAREHYEPAGVSKLRDITTLDPEGSWFNPETKENETLDNLIIDLITDAPDLTEEDVSQEVLKLKGMTGENHPVVRSFSMTQSTWDGVMKRAFEIVRMRLGSSGRDDQGMAKEYSDSVALEMIVADWLAGAEDEKEEIPIPMETI